MDLEDVFRRYAVEQVRAKPGRYSKSSLRADIETKARDAWKDIEDLVDEGTLEVVVEGTRRRLYPVQ